LPPHIHSLAEAIALLATDIESRTGERWIDDAFTGEALRHGIDALLLHLSPTSDGQAAVPARFQKFVAKLPSLRQSLDGPSAFGRLQAHALVMAIENAPLDNHEIPGLSFPAPSGLSSIRRDIGLHSQKEKKQ
jgi:hypothetical protein